jgi:ankyrin repeat protein
MDIVNRLLERAASINAEPVSQSNGRTALQAASENGLLGVVNTLLVAGADVAAYSTDTGFTALTFAMERGHEEVAEALRAAGCVQHDTYTTSTASLDF